MSSKTTNTESESESESDLPVNEDTIRNIAAAANVRPTMVNIVFAIDWDAERENVPPCPFTVNILWTPPRTKNQRTSSGYGATLRDAAKDAIEAYQRHVT